MPRRNLLKDSVHKNWTPVAHTNKLFVSKTKTKDLVISSPNLRHDLLPVPIEGIEHVITLKFLGVILSSILSMDAHVRLVM